MLHLVSVESHIILTHPAKALIALYRLDLIARVLLGGRSADDKPQR
jgi:hypothetical protein